MSRGDAMNQTHEPRVIRRRRRVKTGPHEGTLRLALGLLAMGLTLIVLALMGLAMRL